jgi:hypothetical protein
MAGMGIWEGYLQKKSVMVSWTEKKGANTSQEVPKVFIYLNSKIINSFVLSFEKYTILSLH